MAQIGQRSCMWEKCGRPFEPKKQNQRFCCPEHRWAYNNAKKGAGIQLAPLVLAGLRDLADAHNLSVDEMASTMLAKMLNPQGAPLSDDELWPTSQGGENGRS